MGFTSNTLVIVVAGLLPLAVFTIIQKTNGFWASLFSFFLLGDRLSKVEVLALFIGFIGVYMIVAN
jgi:drug/metabolite transporter (DMT)-like permease